MIEIILGLITFIPWIIYFIEIMLYRINVIERKGLDKIKYFKHIDKNLFSSLNITELILFCIFIIFMQSDKLVALEILFPAIYIYLTIDFFHTLAKDCAKINKKSLMVQAVILVVIIIGGYLITKNLYTTYLIMFIVSILSSFVVYIFSLITSLFKRFSK